MCFENYNMLITISSNILLATLPGAHNHIIIIMASYHHRIIILSSSSHHHIILWDIKDIEDIEYTTLSAQIC